MKFLLALMICFIVGCENPNTYQVAVRCENCHSAFYCDIQRGAIADDVIRYKSCIRCGVVGRLKSY